MLRAGATSSLDAVSGSVCAGADGLPLAGHRDNHGLYLAPPQMEALRAAHGLTPETQWEPYAMLANAPAARRLLEGGCRSGRRGDNPRHRHFEVVGIELSDGPVGRERFRHPQ